MALTTAQLSTLKADILADNILKNFPNNSDGNQAIADAYNALASPDFFVWATNVNINDITDQIIWANLTPQDAVPTDTALNANIWASRSLACQGKQFNLQTMLQGKTTIDASRANFRAGLQDALTQVPSGVSGANRQAGWTAVQLILSRKAKRIEKLLATGTGTQATPALMAFEGSVSFDDIGNARNGA